MNRTLAAIAMIISMAPTLGLLAQSGQMARGLISPDISCNFDMFLLTVFHNGQPVPFDVSIKSVSCALRERPERQVPIVGTRDTKPTPDGGAETIVRTKEFGDMKMVILNGAIKSIGMASADQKKLREFLGH